MPPPLHLYRYDTILRAELHKCLRDPECWKAQLRASMIDLAIVVNVGLSAYLASERFSPMLGGLLVTGAVVVLGWYTVFRGRWPFVNVIFARVEASAKAALVSRPAPGEARVAGTDD